MYPPPWPWSYVTTPMSRISAPWSRNYTRKESYVICTPHLSRAKTDPKAFSLPNSRGLPLMFLPAKFDSSDNLQRLGLAYMTKAGEPAPGAGARVAREPSAPPTTAAAETEKKRKRRQSAPAQAAGIKGAASRATAGSGSPAGGVGGGGRAKKRISLGLPKVDEAAEA